MGVYMNTQSSRKDYNYKEFILDTEDDLTNCPTDCAPGSTAFIVEGAKAYMMNTQGQWVKL